MVNKKYWFMLLLLLIGMTIYADYKKLSAYGDTLYNLCAEYVQTNSTSSSSDVLTYINSSSTATVFSDAKNSGYSRYQLLFQAYQGAFELQSPNQAIIQALHDAVEKENMLNQAGFYATWSTVGWSGITLVYMVRSTYRYLKRDNPLLTFYEQNDQRWLQASMTARAALRGNSAFPQTNPYQDGNS